MALDDLTHRIRPADGDPAGALVLMHGRGVDENDLFPLADLLDPHRRLVVVTPRAPLQPPGHTGNHWYVVERVGAPDAETFARTYGLLTGWVDELVAAHGLGHERLVLGGFSQGAVMSFALGLGRGRPRPAGILALSGFVPAVEGWQPDLDERDGLPVYLAHGAGDPVISVEFARQARALLEGRVDLTYREHPGGHTIDPRSFPEMQEWIGAAVETEE